MQLLICSQRQRAGDRGGHPSSHWNGNSPISEVTHSAEGGRAAHRWQGHQFHETFPPLHLKARHNHAQGRCTMKWNGRPDPGERTQCRVHRNEGHSLPRDASVRRKRPCRSGSGSHTGGAQCQLSFLTRTMRKRVVYGLNKSSPADK